MPLTGLEIYKHLPKTNCKDCGVPTCLAFAMKVAGGKAGLDECPHLSDEGRAQLGEASAPPQRLITIGPNPGGIEVGQETVLFRHDDKFHHPTAIALRFSDADPTALPQTCEAFRALQFVRVGETLTPDMAALVNDSGSPEKMAEAAGIIDKALGVPMVLMSESVASLSAVATGPLKGNRPILYCTNKASVDELTALAKNANATLCVHGTLQAAANAVAALGEKGIKDVLISPGTVPAAQALEFLTQSRRAALSKKFRPLGVPALAMACGEDPFAAALEACTYVCKYAGVVVTDAWEPYLMLTILTTRQNIYTDPQKPVQVEPKIYDVGEVTPESPLLITTNFSLSYYSVEAEVEASRVPCRILAVDTEGTSVLTAWAADKFNAETITAALNGSGVEALVTHHNIVIPGHVAVLAASVADESGWKVLIGPREASGIGPFLKNDWSVA